jgi:lipid-A-disaccharide synthase-like uncharacterized protein
VPTERPTRWARALGGVVGGIYLVLGVGELIAHSDQPVSLAFWAPSLIGGGALVLYGVFGRSRARTKLVVAGALLGVVATAWTLIVPVLSIVLVVLTFNGGQRKPAAP